MFLLGDANLTLLSVFKKYILSFGRTHYLFLVVLICSFLKADLIGLLERQCLICVMVWF